MLKFLRALKKASQVISSLDKGTHPIRYLHGHSSVVIATDILVTTSTCGMSLTSHLVCDVITFGDVESENHRHVGVQVNSSFYGNLNQLLHPNLWRS